MAARKFYITMLEMDNHLQDLNTEERRVTVEPMEDLKEISLDDNVPGRITYIGTYANPSVRKEHALFLKNNQNVFAWSHKDIPGISLDIMVHKLNICPFFPLVW